MIRRMQEIEAENGDALQARLAGKVKAVGLCLRRATIRRAAIRHISFSRLCRYHISNSAMCSHSPKMDIRVSVSKSPPLDLLRQNVIVLPHFFCAFFKFSL
jgi:hypothetical protein